MWDQIIKNLAGFQSAVVSGLDTAGYPFSMRCQPQPDQTTRTLRLDLPPNAPFRPGPASLLCHKHDEFLARQQSFVVRGTLEQGAHGWDFRPVQFIAGVRPDPVSLAKFVIGCRRKASQYLAARSLPRPKIPWEEIIAAKKQSGRRAK
jgi:hypothetical protein